jgi:hypothetical protein
LALVAVTVKL